jgi:TQXA domain-containing protein
MITVQRQRGRRRAAATVAAIAAAAGLIAGMAMPAGAATAQLVGAAPGESGSPYGTAGGTTGSFGGGLFDITIDGTPSQAYCIDIFTPISGSPSYDEVDWATSGVDNLATVEAILRHYYPNGDGPEGFTLTGSNAEKAMGTQAAIWHFTDGFDLNGSTTHNSANVIANYEAILAAVADGLEGFGEPSVTLTITPPASTVGETGGVVGPYVVETTATSVTVTPSEGVSLVDSEGEPFTGEVVDGTELWLSSDSEGEGSISAVATAEATAGRVFHAANQQTLILAAPVTVEAEADAVVSFQAAPPETTTTSTPEETTTTTVPITPETSVVTTPPTTVTVTPEAGTGGGLPVTGAQSIVLAAVALLLVGLGVGFRIVSKRAEGTG